MSRSTSLCRLPKNAATSREVVAGRPSWIDTVGTGSEIRRACDMMSTPTVTGLTLSKHFIPLCAGGEDAPENMQLLTVEEHRRKTKVDLWLCRWLRRLEGKKCLD